MKSPIGLVLVLLIALSGCSQQTAETNSAPGSPVLQAKAVPATERGLTATAGESQVPLPQAEFEKVSLSQADTADAAAEAADRKIIRNANLTMEVSSTTDTQHKISSIAEAHSGFVVTSEARQRENEDPARRTLDIKLVVRVPSERFGPALDQIRGLAGTVREEAVSGQDVTEEFIDLEARIRTQTALELQFTEILKQARRVQDAMEVQRQIADVRTDIEKLEGRKRFLANRSSLSTITVNIEAPRMITVNTSGFGRSLRDSVSMGVDLGSAILLFIVRALIIMVPVTVFLLLPLGLLFRYFVRRAQRIRVGTSIVNPAPATAD
jgi:hypothetical protein